MKVLVTGTRGQLARALAERAPGNDLCLSFAGRPDFDLEHASSIAATVQSVRPDVVVSAAAFTDVEGAEAEPERAFRINAAGISSLAAATRSIDAALIHISTDFVFDGAKQGGYVEDDPTGPLSAYAASKLAGEIEIRSTLSEHVILRASWLYSPFGKNFVTTMLSLAERRTELTVVDDQSGNPTSALDLADAILMILSRWRDDPRRGLGQTFHVAGTGVTTWCRFAKAIFEVSEKFGGPSAKVLPIAASQWPSRVKRPANSALNCSKFEREFGWQAPEWRRSLEPVVARLVRQSQELKHGGR